MIAARYRLEKAPTADEGIQRVWKAGLLLNDEETSAVLVLVSPYHRGEDQSVLDVWLAQDTHTGNDVGMAMVSLPCKDSGNRPVLNLYVNDDHQRQGLGKALLTAAQTHYGDQPLAGYYTLDACRLYQQAGLFPAEIYRSQTTLSLLEQGNLQGAAAVHVDQVLRERQAYEEEMVRYQQRRPRPF